MKKEHKIVEKMRKHTNSSTGNSNHGTSRGTGGKPVTLRKSLLKVGANGTLCKFTKQHHQCAVISISTLLFATHKTLTCSIN